MKQATNTFSLKNNPHLGALQLIIAFLLIVSISGYIFFQLIPKDNNSFFYFNKSDKTIYILESSENENYLTSINTSTQLYKKILDKFSQRLESMNYNVKRINEDEIDSLSKNDILIALDVYYVSHSTMFRLENFLKKGGNLIFNYHFGFFSDKKFVKAENIETLTKLKYLFESNTYNNESNFYTPKILSPISLGDNDSRHDLILYTNDTIPLFKSDYTPDAILSNWEMTSTPIVADKMLDVNSAGVIWHGFYDKGKWFYFSLPGYAFLDMPKSLFKRYINNIYNYFKNDYTIAKYPFLDSKNAVFISEDTEFKFENMIHFAKLSNEKHIPVTLFCVANLALKNKKITKEAAQFDNVEIGSHSYMHSKIQGAPLKKVEKEIIGSKKVLEEITGKKIYGFRPPREEIDKTMEKVLREAGYEYIMEKTKAYMLPTQEHKGLITIPRHGTDDYVYLINLNWNKEKIYQKILQETNMLTALNGIYTLSVHTHLLSYKTNLDVSKRYFDYLNAHKNLRPFNGVEIADRIKWNKKITLSMQPLNDQTFIYINNANNIEIKNFTFRIYWPNSKNITITPELSNVKIKIINENKKRKYTDVQISTLKPNSKISLIIQ